MLLDGITARVIDEVKPYTMVPSENLAQTIKLTIDSVEAGRPGDLVECGTWRGGSSFAMLLAQRYRFDRVVKPVWMFDSFQGLPPADARDGPLALEYQRETDAPGYFDNCKASIDLVRAAIDSFSFSGKEAILVDGWFSETIPAHRASLSRSGIAVLRVDCDWYEPVLYVLEELAACVSDEGSIILDDYYAWDGCARATHDYLSRHSLSWRIRSMDRFYGAWMVKRDHRQGKSEP
jgi:O-methyltransferase